MRARLVTFLVFICGVAAPGLASGQATGTPDTSDNAVRSGANTLSSLPRRRYSRMTNVRALEAVPSLASALDACLYPTAAAEPEEPTSLAGADKARPTPEAIRQACVSRSVRAAARRYRVLAGDRQDAADLYTATSAVGLSAFAAGINHAAKDTQSAWGVVGVLPVVGNDLAAPGPRSRLYNISASAMTVITVRAETIGDALQNAQQPAPHRDAMTTACDALPSPKAPASDAAKFLAAAETRCALLRRSAAMVDRTKTAWAVGSSGLARNLAADAVYLDDTVARLDRMIRSDARDALTVVLKAPFDLASKVVGGASTPPEYQGRALTVFTSTYTFNLGRLPTSDLPAPIDLDLVPPSGDADLKAIAQPLNAYAAELNTQIAALAFVRDLNDRSIMSVRPGEADQPVTLAAPARP